MERVAAEAATGHQLASLARLLHPVASPWIVLSVGARLLYLGRVH